MSERYQTDPSMSWTPEDSLDEHGRTPAQVARDSECQCGYPDWPGRCPGPASCPCVQDAADDELEASNRD